MCVNVSSAVGAEHVGKWQAALAAGASVEVTFASRGDLEASRLALLVGGFKLAPLGPEDVTLVATKGAAAKPRTLLKKKRGPPPAAPLAALSGLDDLVDEDDLLAADGLAPPEVSPDASCSARAPCANCSCGRREALDAEHAAAAASKNTAAAAAPSACGNCGKGDAFRCAGCPYLGKPAFKAGEEKLVLDLTDDVDL